MQTNLLPIAREGWKYLSYSFLFLILFLIFDFDILAFITLLITLFIGVTFRNPERETVLFEKASFLSPSDGRVVSIEEIDDSEFGYEIMIESDYLDVVLLRASSNQKLESLKKYNGTRTSKNSKLFQDLNEYAVLNFSDEFHNKFKIVYTLKNSFFPLVIDLIKGQEINRTSRYGVMSNGVTKLYLPKNFRLNISVGNRVKASESLIGYFS